MNTSFKNFTKLLVLTLILSLTGCQKDQFEEPVEVSESKFNISSIITMDFESISSNKVKNKIRSLNSKSKSKNKNSNLERQSWDQIIIDTLSIKHLVTQEGYESYTFDVLDPTDGNYVENIIISYFPNDSIQTVLATHYLTQSLVDIDISNPSEFITQSSFTLLDETTEIIQLDRQARSTYSCITVGYYTEVEKCEGQLRPGPDCFDENSQPLMVDHWVVLAEDCGWTTIDAGDSSGGGTSSGGDSSGNTGGGGTPDFPDDIIITIPNVNIAAEIKSLLSLSRTSDANLITWLNETYESQSVNNLVLELYAYLEINDFSDEAKDNAELRLRAEYVNDPEDPKWDFSNSGMINNNPSLTYDATYNITSGLNGSETGTMYLLTNTTDPQNNHKQALLISNTPYNINGEYDNTIPPTDIPLDGAYHYLYSYDTKEWYEFGLPIPINDCLACDLNSMFEYVLTNTLIITGRYFLPVEDIIILIDGKDFNGVESSRAVAGGFLLLEIIPGSDLLKLIKVGKYGDEAIEIVDAVRKIADDIYLAQRKVIDDYAGALENATTKRKGNFGEIATDVDLYEKGYKRLQVNPLTDIDDVGHKGIDHVFRNEATGEYLVIESKWGNNGLTAANPNTGLPRQLSDDWITNGLNDTSDRLFNAIGGNTELYDEIISSGYTRLKASVAPDGSVVYRVVGSDGYQINGIDGIFTP